jgi:hypothetical protein
MPPSSPHFAHFFLAIQYLRQKGKMSVGYVAPNELGSGAKGPLRLKECEDTRPFVPCKRC